MDLEAGTQTTSTTGRPQPLAQQQALLSFHLAKAQEALKAYAGLAEQIPADTRARTLKELAKCQREMEHDGGPQTRAAAPPLCAQAAPAQTRPVQRADHSLAPAKAYPGSSDEAAGTQPHSSNKK